MSTLRSRLRAAAAKIGPLDRSLRRLRRTEQIEALQREVVRRRRENELLRSGVNIHAATPAQPEPSQADWDDEKAQVVPWLSFIRRVGPPYPGVEPYLTWAPPGHFYSAVPTSEDIRRQATWVFGRPTRLDGLTVDEDKQLAMLRALAPLARDVAFPAKATPPRRYYLDNPAYGMGDASVLQAFLRYLKPSQYLEVGSGWTTALALDVNETHLDNAMQITCIEPYPEALEPLLRQGDAVEVLAEPVQDVPTDLFQRLRPDDVLFIDCSHVVKTGSDAHHLITRILPLVPVGVYIHIHDIFWPFEYPKPWIEEGRAWSEAYLLHAFLMFNDAFEIVFFNDWFMKFHRDLIVHEIPGIDINSGGAIWLRRVA